MTGPNHADLQRDMGRVEAGLEALEKMMEQGFKDIKAELRDIKTDVEALKTAESQRKGAFQLGHWVIGIIGGVVVFVADHFWK